MDVHFIMTKRFSKRGRSIKTECGEYLKYSDKNVTFGVYNVTCVGCLLAITEKDSERLDKLMKIKDRLLLEKYYLPLTKQGEINCV